MTNTYNNYTSEVLNWRINNFLTASEKLIYLCKFASKNCLPIGAG